MAVYSCHLCLNPFEDKSMKFDVILFLALATNDFTCYVVVREAVFCKVIECGFLT